ncbi:MFS transporter [Horticoccus luteus]|uniref:MFS transporter n=1 Tax=Horticoccus luteus TaxID=2862869 RepID=A0A8F9TVZ2_9BACT|nr:MFS transporter [Horticoccus luteus]QYM78784.1 MFS transporter [Horticoccus luteus]
MSDESANAPEPLRGGGWVRRWRGLAPTARRLLAARFWRSLAQGALVVDLALYLHALGWSGTAIGGVLSGAGLVGAALNVIVGVTSDRLQRKPFLLVYEALTCGCALVAMATTHTAALAAAIVLAGFGRGANGAAGPFSPAEQAWLAEAVAAPQRGMVYSLNTAIGFAGMALGALAATLPAVWRGALGPADSYRPLFAIVLLGNVVNLLLLWRTPERRRVRAGRPVTAAGRAAGAAVRGRENRFLRQLAGLNMLNGLAIGLTGPLITYWFGVRFNLGPGAIAPVMALTFLATAGAALLGGSLTRKAGLVRVVVWGRAGGVAVLLLLPLMPVYALAAVLYGLRSALNRGTIGARQALVVSAISDERRGLAVSLNALSMQIPMSLSPVIAGSLIGAGWFVTPFYVAAVLQAAYVLLYARVFAPQEAEILRTSR